MILSLMPQFPYPGLTQAHCTDGPSFLARQAFLLMKGIPRPSIQHVGFLVEAEAKGAPQREEVGVWVSILLNLHHL